MMPGDVSNLPPGTLPHHGVVDDHHLLHHHHHVGVGGGIGMGGGGVPGGIGGGVSVGVGGGGSPPGGGALLDSSPRTLWLSGFPLDVKHREIHNFFRPYRGYEDSILKPNGIAFVTFTSHEAALTAKNDITGLHFDPDSPEVLKVEFAKQNSKRRREAEEAASPEFWSKEREVKRMKRAMAGSTTAGPPMDVNALYRAGLTGYPFNPPTMYGIAPIAAPTDPYLLSAQEQAPSHRVSSKLNKSLVKFPPGSTLFITNLGSSTSDAEITEIFGRFHGFVRAQIYSRGNNINAFVQYKDYESATQALTHLQGSLLVSSDRGPMKIEYAKNQMVIRKEENPGMYGPM